MGSTRNPGRVAGLWYLLLILIGPLRLIYIPSKLFVEDNATATVHNIAAHECGHLARHRRCRLCLAEPHGRAVAAISGQGIHLQPARLLRGAGSRVVAADQGCHAAAGRDGIIAGGGHELGIFSGGAISWTSRLHPWGRVCQATSHLGPRTCISSSPIIDHVAPGIRGARARVERAGAAVGSVHVGLRELVEVHDPGSS